MATLMRETIGRGMAELRYEPVDSRIRAVHDGQTVVDSRRTLLAWEPGRIVPSYAVPVGDVQAELTPAADDAAPAATDAHAGGRADAAAPRLLHPGIPFRVRLGAGTAYALRTGGRDFGPVAFQPADPVFDGYVVLDFTAFDTWYEEDEPLVSHARDPYHRVDARQSSRSVRIERDGQPLAESRRPVLVTETRLPLRFYLPREDILVPLRPSSKRTYCAYKGEASYWSIDGQDDVAWSYERPLADITKIAGLVAFFDDLFDVTLDGERRERPASPLARMLIEETRG